MDGQRHILDGIKVLDFTHALAGPTVTRLMAEMGAEIIKVEAPEGDMVRKVPFLKNGRSGYFVQQNRGKKSVCVDLKNPRGIELVRALVPKVDVLVENFVPGVIARLGFAYDAVKTLNPRIVMCSLSAFGQNGPLSNKPGFDFVTQAYAGVTSMIGEPEGSPMIPLVALGDVSTGVHAACAIGYALFHRERTGRGQYLDIAMLDAYYHCHEINVHAFSASGGAINPKRSGAHHYAAFPCGVFKARQGYLVIMAVGNQWSSLCRAMGREDLLSDQRYSTLAARGERRNELIPIVENWLASFDSDEAALQCLETHHVPAGPVLSVEQTVSHPHHRHRGTVRTISDRVMGQFDIPGFPLRFSEFPDLLPLEAPYLGEHNAEILERYLGYDADLVLALEREGVLQRE
jgi:crotonobetainyl-CoA:carnitine CoA-transferase CaiB-like acyl-CoA transferase